MHNVLNIVENTKEDKTMGEGIENHNIQMNIVDGDREVMYLTSSKVIQYKLRKKTRAQKMKSYVITTETSEQLKNILSTLDK